MFRKALPYFTNDVALLYYNAFIKSRFSYCLMFWIHNTRAGRYKLLDKIDSVILTLARRCGMNVNDYVNMTGICDVLKCSKLQCMSFMHSVMHKSIHVPYLQVTLNNMIHEHNTRQSADIHVGEQCSLDQRNFPYQCLLLWNECPLTVRLMHKSAFVRNCKLLL